jgi:hypothetical protein
MRHLECDGMSMSVFLICDYVRFKDNKVYDMRRRKENLKGRSRKEKGEDK